MSNNTKKNAILIFCNSDGDLDNFIPMTYDEAYETMEKEAISDWLANEGYLNAYKLAKIEEFKTVAINSSTLEIHKFTASVSNGLDRGCDWNYKIIMI